MPTTVQTKGFSKKDIKHAKVTCQHQAMLGHPSEANFLNMVHLNFIKNCPIIVHDINNATHIFNHYIASTKDKTMRKCSEAVVADYMRAPHEFKELDKNVVISTNAMFVHGLFFVT